MSAPIPDKFARTTRLLVKVSDGKCSMIDGSALPKMKPDAVAELVVSPWDITDEKARAALLQEQRVEFLAAGTSIWARVKQDDIATDLKLCSKNKRVWPRTSELVVEIKLQTAVQLVIRGDGRASLGECNCQIPALPKQKCSSVNEAYTRVSEAFEPSRRSHTGNIFNCVFFENGNFLHPLRKLRDEIVAKTPATPNKIP